MKKMDVNVKILIMLEIIILIVCLASIFLVLAFTLGWFPKTSWNTYDLRYLQNICNVTK